MSRGAVAGAALALVLAGCGDDAGIDEQRRQGDAAAADRRGGPAPGQGEHERVIRGWNQAVNLGRYDRAADFFAPDAVVEQLVEITLDTRADAIAFNRSLPCRADVTDVEREDADSTIAAFSLREGRTGECEEGGSARVRFVIRDGEIEEWRQLPTPPAPRGQVA
jgi:hypothetical protein